MRVVGLIENKSVKEFISWKLSRGRDCLTEERERNQRVEYAKRDSGWKIDQIDK